MNNLKAQGSTTAAAGAGRFCFCFVLFDILAFPSETVNCSQALCDESLFVFLLAIDLSPTRLLYSLFFTLKLLLSTAHSLARVLDL